MMREIKNKYFNEWKKYDTFKGKVQSESFFFQLFCILRANK
jgi:hypothetical protein